MFDLLRGRPLFTALDRDQAADALHRLYRVRRADFAKDALPFAAVANRAQLSEVQLHYCRYDNGTEIAFADMSGFRQMFNLSGAGVIEAGGRTLPIDTASSAILPPNCDFTSSYGAGYSHLVVQYDEKALGRKSELLFGQAFRDRVRLPFLEKLSTARIQQTRAVAMTLAAQFGAAGANATIAVAELTQALISMFLWEHRTGFEDQAKEYSLASVSEASRLEDYIQANWNRALSVEDIAAACGVSVRSVFAQFKRTRGVSPMAYLRDVRLDHARLRLLSDDGASIIDVAMACGFHSLGHFARRYREKFGELPSATLLRAGAHRRG